MEWIDEFERRMEDFEGRVAGEPDQFPVSIKVRVDSGCYDRGCCPAAHEIIDRELDTMHRSGETQFRYIKHESGPEILAYAGAAMGLAASVIGLVTVIIQARAEGRKKGDRHNDPVTLVVRRIETADTLLEERVMTFTGHEKITPKMIEAMLTDGIKRIAPKTPAQPKAKQPRRKNEKTGNT
jgi:hypothetical protein